MQTLTRERSMAGNAAALAAFGRHLTNAVDGRIEEWNGVVMCSGRYVSRAKNMVVPLRPIEKNMVAQLTERLLEFYGSTCNWLLWNVFPDALEYCDYDLLGTNPIMEFTGKRPIALPDCPGVTVKEVTDDAGCETFEKLREQANGPHIVIGTTNNEYLDARALGNGLRLWLAYKGHQPVATAAIFEKDGVSMIKNVTTLPDYRRQGIATYISAVAANACQNAPLLDSDPPAVNMYTRLGFEQIGTIRYWSLAQYPKK